MIKSFRDLGAVGCITDTDPRLLPDNAWTEAKNIRFTDGVVLKSKGESSVYTTPAIDPYWLLPVQTESTYYWVYPSLAKCYITDGTTNSNITRQTATAITASSLANPTVITAAGHGITDQDTVVITGDTTATPAINGTYTATVLTDDTFTIPVNVTVAGTDGTVTADTDYSATADIGWTGGNIGSVPIVNNGVDSPQMWSPVGAGTRLQSLTWASGQTWSSQSKLARVVRPFKQFLVALDCTESGTRYRQRVRWSHPADSGSVPATWDETDPTKDAGAYDLEEGGGSLIDCLPLRDTNIIYKDNHTVGMQHIGGQYVFRFYNIFDNSGILSRRCVKSFHGKHFVVNNGDVIVHDGSSINTVINHRKRKELFGLIDSTNYQRTFVSPNYQRHEMWVCFPQTGSSFADTAMIWNYKDDTWTTKDLPTTKHIGYGLVDPGGVDTWAGTGTWDLDPSLWGELNYSPTIVKNLMAGSTKFYLADDTDQSDGNNITAYVQKTSMDFGEPDRVKYIKRLWPRMKTTGAIDVSIGTQMGYLDPIQWTDYTLNIGDSKVDCGVTGRLVSIRFKSSSNISWSLSDFDIEYDMKGRF